MTNDFLGVNMKKLFLFAIAVSMLALAGCKTEVFAPVSYSEIFGDPKIKMGGLAVEVPSCFDSSKKFESSSVIEAKQKVPYVFPKAEYVRCDRKGFDSFAIFWVPFQVGGTRQDCKDDQVCVYKSRNNQFANAVIGTEILKKAKELGKIDGDDLRFYLGFNNDSGRDLDLWFYSAYVDGNPGVFKDYIIKKDAKDVEIKLSNVSSSTLLTGSYVNMFRDFNRPETKTK